MKAFVQGIGAVTPLGPSALATWNTLCQGHRAPRKMMASRLGNRDYYWCPVPAKYVSEAARHPRLRRSGTVSLLGAAAGFDALADAGLKALAGMKERVAFVFVILWGGVTYTPRS